MAISIFDYMTLNMSRAALCSGIIFTQLRLTQPIPSWHVTVFMLIRYVTLWPRPLAFWPWTLAVDRICRD